MCIRDSAWVRALALDVACEIHPLNNLRVLRFLTRDLKLGEDEKNRWYRHWVETGLETVERQLVARPATFCHGDRPGMACLLNTSPGSCAPCEKPAVPTGSRLP